MHYYPFHIGDFRSGTVNMSRLARWLYRDMIDVYYDTEKPLPLDLDVLCNNLGAEMEEERAAVERLLRFKFVKTDAGYRHTICDEVIMEYHKKAETARANGKGGGRPRKSAPLAMVTIEPTGFQSGSDSEPTGSPIDTGLKTKQEPKNQQPEEDLLPPGLQPGGDAGGAVDQDSGDDKPPRLIAARQGLRFADFWATWPKNERKQDKAKCLAKWKLNGLDAVAELILADIRLKGQTKKWQDGFIEAPLVYLNGRRWEDGVAPQVAGEHVELGNWWDTKGGVQRRATELGIGPWEAVGPGGVTVPWGAYVNRVRAAANKADGQAS